ncbi:MAG: acyltransferase family protein [Cyanobacteria bacterium J083]|nr:MAG: acyltransferase family protein [Cyanobacteria bacterium J083]
MQPGWSLQARNPEFIDSLMPYWEFFYRYYFRVETAGWENISPGQNVLLVGSHNGGLASPDMMMTMYDWFRHFGTKKPAYGLMHPTVWKTNPYLSVLAEKAGALVAHPKMALAALQSGATVLVYPGGAQDVFRPHSQRHRIHLAGRKGFIKIALRTNVPIVPVISVGAHDTMMVLGDCYELVKKLHQAGMPWLFDADPEVFPIYLGLPWGIALGPLPNIPLPAKIKIKVCPPIYFAKYGQAAARDRQYVDSCYNLVRQKMQTELDALVAASKTDNWQW